MIIFKSGTYDGLFVTTDYPIINDVQGFFDIRDISDTLIPKFDNRQNTTLLIRCTGLEGVVTVSVVYYAKDINLRDGFFSITACETTKNVSKNFKKFLTISIASIFNENLKNNYYDVETTKINGIPKLVNQNAKPKSINYLPSNFDFKFSKGFGVNWLEKTGLLEISNTLEKNDVFNQLIDGFELFFNINHPQSFEYFSFLLKASVEQKLKDQEKEKNLLAKQAANQKKKIIEAQKKAEKEEQINKLKNFTINSDEGFIEKNAKLIFLALVSIFIAAVLIILFFVFLKDDEIEVVNQENDFSVNESTENELKSIENDFLACAKSIDEYNTDYYHFGIAVDDNSAECPKILKNNISDIFNTIYGEKNLDLIRLVPLQKSELSDLFLLKDTKIGKYKNKFEKINNFFLLVEGEDLQKIVDEDNEIYSNLGQLYFSQKNSLSLFCSKEIIYQNDINDPIMGPFKQFPLFSFLSENDQEYNKKNNLYNISNYIVEKIFIPKYETLIDEKRPAEKILKSDRFYYDSNGNILERNYIDEYEKIYQTRRNKKLKRILYNKEDKVFNLLNSDTDNSYDANKECIFTSNVNTEKILKENSDFIKISLSKLGSVLHTDTRGYYKEKPKSCYGFPKWVLLINNSSTKNSIINNYNFMDVEKSIESIKITSIDTENKNENFSFYFIDPELNNDPVRSSHLKRELQFLNKFNFFYETYKADDSCVPDQIYEYRSGLE